MITIGNSKTSFFTKTLCFYFLCLPFGAMSIGPIGSLLKIIAIIPVGVYIIRHPRTIILKPVRNHILLCLCIGLSVAWSINFNVTISALKSQVLFLILLLAVSGFRYNNAEINLMKQSLRWSSRITAAITLYTGFYFEGRLTLGGVINEDPNLLCAYFLFGIVAVVIELLSKPGLKKTIIDLIELFVYLYIVFSTGSRGGAISVFGALLIIYFFYNDFQNNKSTLRKITVSAIFVIVFSFSIKFVPEEIISRFSIEDVARTGGTHRTTLWKNAIDIFKQSNVFRQLFGYGAGCTSDMRIMFGYSRYSMHNAFLKHMLEVGIIGLVTYTVFVAGFIVPCIKRKKYFELAVIIGMVLLSLSTDIVYFKPYWNIQIYILCTCYLSANESENS